MRETSNSPQKTMQFAAELLKQYPEAKIWLLYGDLATGKTTFVKGLAEALKLSPHQVKSPTFTFVTEYEKLIHYDLYRLEKADSLLNELLEEHMQSGKQVAIEWPNFIEDSVLTPHLKIYFKHEGADERSIEVIPVL